VPLTMPDRVGVNTSPGTSFATETLIPANADPETKAPGEVTVTTAGGFTVIVLLPGAEFARLEAAMSVTVVVDGICAGGVKGIV